MTEPVQPLSGQPIQIQLPPVLQDIMQQWPVLIQRVTAMETKPALAAVLPPWLVALAAFTIGVLSLLAGQWAWGKWGF